MRFLIGLAIFVMLYLGVKSLISHWGDVQSHQRREGSPTPEAEAEPAPAPGGLTGLPPHLESSLEAARRQGPSALKIWLKNNRTAVQDPRLADIELDYVVLVAPKNFGEAREVLSAVKARIPETSPVYPKLKKLLEVY